MTNLAMKYGEDSNALLSSNGYEFFEKAEWLTTVEAAIYLRKFRYDGTPSPEAVYMMLQRGRIRRRKFNGRLYFNKQELRRALDIST